MSQAGPSRPFVASGGQSQGQRYPPALDPDFARVDDKTDEDLIDFAQSYAENLVFVDPVTNQEDGTWGSFFNATAAAEALQTPDGNCAPHLALYLAFLRLLGYARTSLNGLTKRHLDFYYREVLKFSPRGPEANRVHVLFELQKGIEDQKVQKGALLSAGKDDKGHDLFYALAEDIIVNTAAVGTLRSVFVDRSNNDLVHVAPIADSSDGLGGALDEAEPKWKAFGAADRRPGEIGFAVASPILRLQEGDRTIEIHLTVAGFSPDTRLGAGAFNVYLTGKKGWMTPGSVSLEQSSERLTFTVTLPADEDPVVDYDPQTHGGNFTTSAPIVQVLLNSQAEPYPYAGLKDVRVTSTRIEVKGRNIANLTAENGMGKLDTSKPFLPFGPEPQEGSSLYLECDELLDKNITRLCFTVKWQGAPQNLKAYYAAYTRNRIPMVSSDDYFGITVTTPTGQQWCSPLFNPPNDTGDFVEICSPPGAVNVRPAQPVVNKTARLLQQKSRWAQNRVNEIQMLSRVASPLRLTSRPPAETTVGATRPNRIQWRLQHDFLHEEYRQLYVKGVIDYANGKSALNLPNEPYVPVMASLTLDYDAVTAEVSQISASEEDYLRGEVEFFHVAAFGQMREHSFEKGKIEFLTDRNAYLLPQYRSEGTFYVGLKSAKPLQHVPILFQVADGTANVDKNKARIKWSILSDNHWRYLKDTEILSDGTDGLLRSGIVKFSIPSEATDTNTLLPAGYHWLRAEIAEDMDAVCQLVGIYTNAAEAQSLAPPLKAKTITKLAPAVAGVKSVAQPYASFGGKAAEDDRAFYARVSERLRHKNRAVTAWDYERLVLERFPSVYKVKCIVHTSGACGTAPGHVTLIVVPDLNRKYQVNPLEPKTDKGTLSEIQTYLEKRAGPFVSLHVENPSYEQIKLDFKVRFRTASEFGYYKDVLSGEITQFLCPWAYARGEDIAFGGHVHRSVLLHFVEDRSYVDYVTDFKMYHIVNGVPSADLEVAGASGTKSILVSAGEHTISSASG